MTWECLANDSVARIVAFAACELLGADRGAMFVRDHDGDLKPLTATGFANEPLAYGETPASALRCAGFLPTPPSVGQEYGHLPLPAEPPDAYVRTVDVDDRCIVELTGEIDLCNSTRVNLEFELIFSRASPPRSVRVDCSRVTFMDSLGLAVLLKAQRSADSAGSVLWVEPRSPTIDRLLAVSGLTRLLARDAE